MDTARASCYVSGFILTLILLGYRGSAYIQRDVRNWPKGNQFQLIRQLAQNSSNPSKTIPLNYSLHCITDTCVQPTTYHQTSQRPIVGVKIERDFLPSTYEMYELQCLPVKTETDDHRLIDGMTLAEAPVTETRTFRYPLLGDADMRYVTGHVTYVNNVNFLSLLEPGGKGGCANKSREYVQTTARTKRCLAAINGGFFDAYTCECVGNVISEGRLVSNSSTRNAHFGVTKDNRLFFGYVGTKDVERIGFRELVNGVGWLVRDGKSNVEGMFRNECIYTVREEEDAVLRFIQVSSRVAIGHDSEGRAMLVNVNGKTYQNGMDLYEFADFLVAIGVRNAVNFDGGGSVTLVLNGTVTNEPADLHDTFPFMKTRKLMTVMCAHAPYCQRSRCHKPGTYMVDEECLCYEV